MKIKSKFQYAQHVFRKLHLLSLIEYIDYLIMRMTYCRSNTIFIKKNPDFIVPPKHLAYDAYSAPDWEDYKISGEESAIYLRNVVREYLCETSVNSILEWGCGPGRIIRHLPKAFDEKISIYGCDYNSETIEWCKKNIPEVDFTVNELKPPLHFSSNKFDFIYVISVFTHLSESIGLKWIEELYRLLKPNGILLITLKGDSYYNKLLRDEKIKYDSAGIVVRGNFKEGKKMFATFHNPKYVRNTLLSKFSILKHITLYSSLTDQDTWIARKA